MELATATPMRQLVILTPSRRRLAAGAAVALVLHGLLIAGVWSVTSTLKPLSDTPVTIITLETWDVQEARPITRPIIQKSRMVTREETRGSALNLHEAKIILPQTETHELPSSGEKNTPAPGDKGKQQGTGGDGDYWSPGLNPVQQALNFGTYCRRQQTRGEKPHASCELDDLASMPAIGPRDPDGVMSRADREQRYKTSPGNADYWRRVNGSPSPSYRPDDIPRPGSYSNPKDERVMGGR